MRYWVTVDGEAIEVELNGDRVTVAGRTRTVTWAPIPGTPLHQLILDGRPLTISVVPLGRGRWALTPAGERWEVEVVDERTRHIRSLTGASGEGRAPDVLKAPMPGLVVRVQAKPGDKVTAGAGLVVLEAMKMENELKAAAPGVVRAVRVVAGEAVEKGQVLVEFDGNRP